MMEQPPFVSIKFDAVGRAHRFLLPEVGFKPPLRAGDAVVVARSGRPAYGTVSRTPAALAERAGPPPQSHVVLRRASEEDVAGRLQQQHREREALRVARLKAAECGLPVKLVRVEQPTDRSRLTVYFTASERVDFRALVRELAAHFGCRIEMRQIGARDEARLLGGYGTCGRPLCCTTWLKGFEPVTIKMAKRQQLSLSPSRLSGLCGRLKCCLRYELPNAAGEQFAGCAHEGSCSRSGGGCGTDGCGSGACTGCR